MNDPTDGLPLTFVFDGKPGEVLRRHFEQDAAGARLSAKFRLYYKLRPWIPIPMRQWLQRGRNQAIEAVSDWFVPSNFIHEFRRSVESSTRLVVHPWPDDWQMAASLTHDVETQVGFGLIDSLAKIEEEHGLRSAWNIIPHKYKVDLGLLRDLQQRGHEIGVHGYNHDGRLFESKRLFDSRVTPINAALQRYAATGFRAPMVHRNLAWLQSLQVDYDASTFDVDPYQAMPGGVGGVWPFMAGKFVELPYTLPQDHTLLISLGETTPAIWIRKFECLRSLAGMAMLVTHPDYLDTPGRLRPYRDFLGYLAEQSDCWTTLPREIAAWWRIRDSLTVRANEPPDIRVPSSIRSPGDGITGDQSERARLVSLAWWAGSGLVPSSA